MDRITAHVIERMAERLKRTIDGEEYNSLCQAASNGVIVRRQDGSTQRVFRFKRKWMLAVYDEAKRRVITCWRPCPKLIEAAKVRP